MSPSRALLTTAFALSLTACGGGGGNDAPPPPAAPDQATVSLTEFEGVWKREATHVNCIADFVYNTAYHHRLRDITWTNLGNGRLELALATRVYDDNACTMERGVVTERFTMTALPVTRSGRDNVFRADPVFSSSTSGGTGGLSITLKMLPDGRMSELDGVKLISDVRNGQLEISTSTMGLPLDNSGYPKEFEADNYWIR